MLGINQDDGKVLHLIFLLKQYMYSFANYY